MSDFGMEILKEKEEVKFHYPKDILNTRKYKHKKFYIKNIGNADINQLDICVSSQKHSVLTSIEDLKHVVENNNIDYNYIMIDIAYLDEDNLGQLLFLFKDSYNNLYQQPFFVNQGNLYEPRKINYKEYRLSVTTETAIE